MIGILDMQYVGTYNDTDGYEHIRPKLIGDTISDRPTTIIFQQRYKLEIGTTFHCISDGTDWEMKSDATWVQFIDSYLTNTYTKQEIDVFVSGLNTRIDDVEDEQSNQLDYIRRLVDEGAKNIMPLANPLTTETKRGITADYDFLNGTITLNGVHDGTGDAIFYLYTGAAVDSTPIPAGSYHLNGCPSGGSTESYCLIVNNVGGSPTYKLDTGNGQTFTISEVGHMAPLIRIRSGSYDNVVFRPMMCRLKDWNISEKFVPYTPTLHELYEMIRGYHP